MSEFVFSSDNNIPSAKYEFVNLLQATPQNVKDYHDLENIIRHRMIMLVKELYGNVRVSPTDSSPFSIYNTTYISASGTWYIDGYRVTLDNEISTSGMGHGVDYSIQLNIKLAEIDYTDTEGQGIALRDEKTGSIVETSTRFMFDFNLKPVAVGTNTTATGYDASYIIGKAVYNSNTTTWDFEEVTGFKVVDTKYDAALAVVQNAVHEVYDEVLEKNTVTVPRLQTNDDTSGSTAKAFIEEVSPTKIKLGFENEAGDHLAAFEMVYQNSEWTPILWMQPGTIGYPIAYLTPDGFNVFDNRGHSGYIKSSSLAVGNKYNGFKVDNDELKFITGNKVGLHVKREIPDSSSFTATVDNTDVSNTQESLNDPEYGTNSGCRIKSDNNQTGVNAIYTFEVPYDDWPTDRMVEAQHKIMLDNGYYNEAIVSANIYVNHYGQGGYTLLQKNRWILRPGKLIINDPIFIDITSLEAMPAGESATIKIEYMIDAYNSDTDNSEALVGFKNLENIKWVKFSDVYPVANIDTLKINNGLLWVDNDNQLRLKYISNETNPAVAISTLKSSSAGTSPTDNGGIVIGGSDLNNVDITVGKYGTTVKPRYYSGTKEFDFPLASSGLAMTTEGGGGLITSEEYEYIMNNLSTALDTIDNVIPAKVCYVSKNWSPAQAGTFPYFNTINSAVAYLSAQESSLGNNVRGGSVIVHPGLYVEDVDLQGGRTNAIDISIVAPDPAYTKLNGQIGMSTSSGSVNAYIDIPIIAPAGKPAVDIKATGLGKVVFGPKTHVTSNIATKVINITSGTVEFNGKLEHTISYSDASIVVTDGSLTINNTSTFYNVTNAHSIALIKLVQESSLYINNSIIGRLGSVIKTKCLLVYSNPTAPYLPVAVQLRNSHLSTEVSNDTAEAISLESGNAVLTVDNCTVINNHANGYSVNATDAVITRSSSNKTHIGTATYIDLTVNSNIR